MTSNKETLNRLHEAINSGDEDLIDKTIDEVFEPGVLIRTPLRSEKTGTRLVKEIFTVLRRAFPDLRIKAEDVIAEGDKVVYRNTVTGTHKGDYLGIPATGKSISYNEVIIGRVAGGRIVETWGVVDVLAQLRQLGAIPSTFS